MYHFLLLSKNGATNQARNQPNPKQAKYQTILTSF